MVERMDHSTSNCSICHRSRYVSKCKSVMTLTKVVVGFVYFASWTYFTSAYFPNLPNYGKCAGEEFAAFAGMGILSSYLLLFISFYLATYTKPSQRHRRASEIGKRAAIDMKNLEVPDVDAAKGAMGSPAKANGSAMTSGKAMNGSAARSRKV